MLVTVGYLLNVCRAIGNVIGLRNPSVSGATSEFIGGWVYRDLSPVYKQGDFVCLVESQGVVGFLGDVNTQHLVFTWLPDNLPSPGAPLSNM